ncbi:hypothetical protein EYF80_024487 [Liparis tanakae]|uniref:Uncharacterized protein n=1 Tax=Liparis tanakae TaxID=230148 RepID=A0A4Z2HKD9_9TELE|nr:hypothetical protein EYF80_024487 [Liparis tanakae]
MQRRLMMKSPRVEQYANQSQRRISSGDQSTLFLRVMLNSILRRSQPKQPRSSGPLWAATPFVTSVIQRPTSSDEVSAEVNVWGKRELLCTHSGYFHLGGHMSQHRGFRSPARAFCQAT